MFTFAGFIICVLVFNYGRAGFIIEVLMFNYQGAGFITGYLCLIIRVQTLL